MDEVFISVTPYLNVQVVHCYPIERGSDLYRVILDLVATQPASEAGKFFKSYEVWVTREAVEDMLRMTTEATVEDIKKFAIDLLRGRCNDEDHIPDEDGAFILKAGEITLGNPRTFLYKVPNKQKLVKTTIQLPEDTYKWLKDYGYERNAGLGESIRRLVANFQAGTVTRENVDDQKVQSTAGVPSPDEIEK
jgi:hypothetical protein